MGIEDRLRHSLRERASDVEPTPALQLEVQRRLRRGGRARAVAWSAAAAAAVLAAVVAVPTLLPETDTPQIDPVEEAPGEPVARVGADDLAAGADVPRQLVLAEGDELVLVDLDRGDETRLPAPTGDVVDIAVRPGTGPGEGLEIAYATTDGDDEAAVGVIDAEGNETPVDEAEATGAPGTSLVWGPEGDWLAWTTGAAEGQARLAELSRPAASGADVEIATASLDDPTDEGRGPVTLTDWVHDGPGDPVLLGTFSEGSAVEYRPELTAGGTIEVAAIPSVEGLQARSEAAPERDGTGGGYALVDHGDGLALLHTSAEEQRELPVPEDLGPRPHRLEGAGDAVVVTDADRGWLVTRGGEGTRIAPLGEVRAVSAVRDVAAPDEPSVADADEGELEEVAYDELVTTPALEVEGRSLRLRMLGTVETLHELPEDRRFESVVVHPDSEAEAITAVALERSAQGSFLVHLEVEDRELVAIDRHAVGIDEDAAETSGLAMGPDGDAVAWLEQDEGPTLRVGSWDDGPVGEVEVLPVELPEGIDAPLQLQGWDDLGDGLGQVRLVPATEAGDAVTVELAEGDGGLEVVGEPEVADIGDGEDVRAVSAVGAVIERERLLLMHSAMADGEGPRALPQRAQRPDAAVSLGPSVEGAAPLHVGDDVWLVEPERIAPWPSSADEVALVPDAVVIR